MFDCFPNYKLLNVNLKEKFGVEGVYLFLFFYFILFFFFPFFFFFKTEKETQMYRTVFWTLWEKARVGCFKRTASCMLSRVKQITSPGWMHETSARTWCTGKT